MSRTMSFYNSVNDSSFFNSSCKTFSKVSILKVLLSSLFSTTSQKRSINDSKRSHGSWIHFANILLNFSREYIFASMQVSSVECDHLVYSEMAAVLGLSGFVIITNSRTQNNPSASSCRRCWVGCLSTKHCNWKREKNRNVPCKVPDQWPIHLPPESILIVW